MQQLTSLSPPLRIILSGSPAARATSMVFPGASTRLLASASSTLKIGKGRQPTSTGTIIDKEISLD